MADLLISPLVSSILKTLNSLVLKEFGIAWGLKAELENLESTLSTIQAVLQDAETKQGKNEALKNWLRKLNDAAYDADNLVDEFMTEALRRMDSERGIKPQVSAPFSLRNRLIFRLKMGHKIKDMRDRLDAIAGEKNKFHLREDVVETEEVSVMGRGQTSSLVNELEIFGRTNEKEMIIEMLLNNSSDRDDDASVYAMCGMGGLGKTALAQLVYNDRKVDSHFDLRIWVCVSVDFDVERLTRAILESIEGGGCSISNLDPLLRRLQEKLRGKRFLIVLDDVWNEYHEKWDRLKNALKCGAKGCTVIVTTRIQKVALIMATLPIHHMARLSEDDSWSLFERHAFGNERREENLQLDLIGKEIVKKCKGLPLAIKALGSLMQFKRSESEWLSVKESEIWDLPDDGSGILPSLRLSYEALRPHLRQCFAYCCIFPKDYRMEKDMLIGMWMANDFIPSKGKMTFHIGDKIFKDLVWRSFLEDVEKNKDGRIFCKMHDLMHDLAQSIMRYECSFMEPHEGMKIPNKIRHLFFNSGFGNMVPWNEIVFEVPSLRSLILRCRKKDSSPFISKQKYLRVVLDFRGNVDEKLSMSISNFNHLRYLNLSWSDIKILPESISNLQNLQTLKLRDCDRLCKLPKRMKHMRNLTYLDITGCDSLTSMPDKMGQLTCLQRLSMFIVGQDEDITGCDSLTSMPDKMGQLTCLQRLSMFIVGQDEGYQIGELKELNLGGTLSIKRLENVRNSEDAKKANLKGKHDLISLELYWSKSNEENRPKNVEEVLESLQPNSNLKKLSINCFQGSKFPNWMLGLVLKNLVEISLRGCERCEHLPPLGKLQSLKILIIGSMDSLKYFNHGDYGDGESSFPALKTLKFYRMPSLEEWAVVDRGEICPCLRELVISGCSKLTKLPFLPALERLTIERDNKLKIFPDGLPGNLKPLEYLELDFMYNMKTLSNQLDNLFALKFLHLSRCPGLENLSGLKNLNSLQTLHLWQCNGLTSLPVQGLQGMTSLTSLHIHNCKLISLSDGMQYLTALRNLSIIQCPEIQSFPEGMQHLNALQDLDIDDCGGLISLPNWLGSLRSLSSLEIWRCPNLRCLPDGLQDQNTLKTLTIGQCPHLERRCKKQTGEDWLKIARIPEIWINVEQVQSLDC